MSTPGVTTVGEDDVAFVFSSQGSQWPGLGRRLVAERRVARDVVHECDRVIRERLGWSLEMEIAREPAESRLHSDPYFVQPTLTAIQIAVARVLENEGIRPNAVAGLSMGEVAALHVAGGLDLSSAMDVTCAQARLTCATLPGGGMWIVGLGADEVRSRFPIRHPGVSIAVEFGPDSTVLSGERASIASYVDDIRAAGIRVTEVPTGFALHSVEQEPLRVAFLDQLTGLRARAATIPAYSSVTGGLLGDAIPDATYWWAMFEQPSPFARTLDRLIADGYRTVIEIGPQPTLAQAIRSTAQAHGVRVRYSATMQGCDEDLDLCIHAVRLYGGGDVGAGVGGQPVK